jgi:hypothetical protein
MDYKARFYDPYITQFSQPDSIIPDLYNPQALNRYSYTLNNPIKYNDPTGYWVDEGCGSGEGCDLPPVKEDSEDKDDEDNWPDDPPWDYYPAPIEWQDPIDILFNPWAGASYGKVFTDPDSYYQDYYEYRRLSMQAYMKAGLDLRLIVDDATLNHANNWLTEEQASDLAGSLVFRKSWEPYNKFLSALNLGTGPAHITNYEPRFLEGLMVANPKVLQKVKDAWIASEAANVELAEIRQLLRQRGPSFGTSFTQ